MRLFAYRKFIVNSIMAFGGFLVGPVLAVAAYLSEGYFRAHNMKDVSDEVFYGTIVFQAAYIGLLLERRAVAARFSVPRENVKSLELKLEESRHQVDALLRQEQEQSELINLVLDNAPVGFALVNPELKYQRVNTRLADMLGVTINDLVGNKLVGWSPEVTDILAEKINKVFTDGKTILNLEVSGRVSHNLTIARQWAVGLFPVSRHDKLMGVGMIVQEITEEKRAHDEVSYYASHDILTGLPNRKSFEEHLARAVSEARQKGAKAAVFMLDMDRFKDINDTLGHDIGDSVLKEAAIRLRASVRERDLVARWGGDEFVILLPVVEGLFEINRVADRILKAFGPVIHLEQHTLPIATSVGIAVYPHDGLDVRTLLKNADVALYRAKDLGKNRYEYYKAETKSHVGERLTLETELRAAVEQNQMCLYFQPIMELKSGNVVAVETLVRWKHPSLGLLRPRQFIPLAEETGLINSLGRWILLEATRQIQDWIGAGLGPLEVAVNISSRQFAEEDLVDGVRAALAASGLDPGLLELEITESLAMENIDRTRNKIIELNELGVNLTIDDFGTGYSSLSYLKSFPVSKLKIDKSFVKHSITEEQDSKIIRAICAMADSMRLKVIAEGVDTEQQIGLLSSLGCYAVQGYFISKPLSAEEFPVWLRGRAVASSGMPEFASDKALPDTPPDTPDAVDSTS